MTWGIEEQISDDRQKFEAYIESYNPTDYFGWWYKAKALSALKRFDDAIMAFDKAIWYAPDDQDNILLIKKQRAECADHIGLKSIELEESDPIVEPKDTMSARVCINNGILFAENNCHEEAIAQFDEAIIFDQTDFYPHFCRGESLFALEKFDDAILSFDLALECNNISEYYLGKSEIYFWKGKSLAYLKKYHDAALAFEQAISDGNLEEAQLEEAYLLKGIAFADLEIYDMAIDSFNQLINKDVIHEKIFLVKSLRYKGEVLLNLGRNKEASISLLNAIDLLLDEQNEQ
jgi:tetratricopeptide (TPR) repeat protein